MLAGRRFLKRVANLGRCAGRFAGRGTAVMNGRRRVRSLSRWQERVVVVGGCSCVEVCLCEEVVVFLDGLSGRAVILYCYS